MFPSLENCRVLQYLSRIESLQIKSVQVVNSFFFEEVEDDVIIVGSSSETPKQGRGRPKKSVGSEIPPVPVNLTDLLSCLIQASKQEVSCVSVVLFQFLPTTPANRPALNQIDVPCFAMYLN